MKKAFALFATILLFSFTTYAQNSATGSATVTAKITKGLTVTNLGGSLDFGEMVATTGTQNPSITPASGANFLVVGHRGKAVNITFNSPSITNNAWVSSNGGTNASIPFSPSVEQTGGSNTYSGATTVTSGGSAISLVDPPTNNGTGVLYLWVGGSLGIAANQANGDYTGTFTISVIY